VDENKNVRCFARFPIESLASGIFSDMQDVKAYITVYSQHQKRMGQEKGSEVGFKASDNIDNSNSPKRKMFSNFVSYLCEKSKILWSNGEIISASESMLQLYSLLSDEAIKESHCYKQIVMITSSKVGLIRSTLDAVKSAKCLMNVLLFKINSSAALINSIKGRF
jgi:hypothetical protein